MPYIYLGKDIFFDDIFFIIYILNFFLNKYGILSSLIKIMGYYELYLITF